jgi:hypothetical protein
LSQERLASTDRSKAIGKENSASEGSDDFQKKFGGVCEERGQRYKECRNERGFLGMLVSYEEGTYSGRLEAERQNRSSEKSR